MNRRNPYLRSSIVAAVLVNAVALILLFVGLEVRRSHEPAPSSPEPVHATVIDAGALREAEERKRRAAEEARRKAEAERKRRAAEEARRKAEAERKRRAAEEARRKAEAERKRRAAEEARRKAEAERKRRAAEEARRKAEAERKRRAAEEARRKAEAEQRARRLATLQQRYVASIRAHVERAWRRPPGVQSSDQCLVEVRQTPEGRVTDVRTLRCSGDEAFRRSVEDAVWRADPLPTAPDPAVFDRIIQFEFIVQ